MDEMKLTSKLMRGVAAKLIRNMFKKKFGCEVKLNLNDFYVTYDETTASVHIDVNAQMDKDNLESVLIDAGLL
ncbi:MAG: CTP synthase [Clostridiales bacterium]|nr:CTP synthase [Clostridiales bacterium]